MRKVCILTTVHPPFDTRIFHKQAKTLLKAGYDVTLIAQHDKDEVRGDVRIIALPKPQNRLKRILVLTRQVLRLALHEKADVYHFHDPELILTCLLLKILSQAKVVYDIHENVPGQITTKTWLPIFLRCPLKILYNILERATPYFFDAVIVAAEDIAYHFHSKSVVTIHNYPLIEWLDSKRSQTRGAAETETFTVIYIGNFRRTYGIENIIQAVKYLDDGVRLVLLGAFHDKEYEREIKNVCDDQIIITGKVAYEKVLDYLLSAEIGLSCPPPDPNNIQMAQRSNKLFEYMAAGLPVIASDFPSWRTIVEGNDCGLMVDPLNPKQIAETIEYLRGHPEQRRKMGENGRRAIREQFNWKREAETLLGLYRVLMNRRVT